MYWRIFTMTENKTVLAWLEEMKAMCQPDNVVWIDGSEEQLEALRAEAVATGEMIKLNQEKLPGCYYHRTAENDVARVEDRTFICTPTEEEAGPINNWMAPDEMYAKLKKLYTGSMKGRTMYVIPYSMGPIGSPFSKIGIELSDSIYVVLNMAIMTRIGQKVLDQLGNDENAEFIKCLHAKKDVNPDDRYIVQFPQDNTIWSINSAYGGNVLLVPVYGVCYLADALVINSIEFWSGSNPMASIGDVKKVKGENGDYLVETLENGYSITKEGETASMELIYNKELNTWNVVADGVSTELLQMNNDGTAQMTLPNGEEMTVTLDAQGVAAARQATMIDSYYAFN